MRFRAISLLALTVLGLGSLPVSAGMNSTSPSVTRAKPQGQTLPTYQVVAGLNGEIFPVFANYASLRPIEKRTWGIVTVKVTNSSEEILHQRVAVQVNGWSDQEIQLVDVPVGKTVALKFAPTFYPRLYNNKEITAATATVTVTDNTGAIVYAATSPVRLRSADDMYWGSRFEYANYIASWVTPHDTSVEQVLTKAKDFMPMRRLPGYETGKSEAQQERTTRLEARAIYRALQLHGVSYVKSSMTFGASQSVSERVRTPGEALFQASANCIDGALVFASLFENLAMEPIVVVLPGHAIVGVRTAPGSNKYLFLDASLTGRATFEASVAAAERVLASTPQAQVVRIPIQQAREVGIYPMPISASLAEVPVTAPRQVARSTASR